MLPLTIHLHNSLSGKREILTPLRKNQLGMYVCGVTTYDRCHLGHIRAAVNFDVIRNFLSYAGYQVTFVKNYTDIDDKIILRANSSGVDWKTLTQETIARHDADMALFGVRPPDIAPKATDHIPNMIAIIEDLVKKNIAYESGGDVYFKADEFKEYGRLSGKIKEELDPGRRIDVSDLKRGNCDFVLWKTAKPGEPYWKSPWGNGRPGWHIECSAMAIRYLGNTFDIHGGGSDLMFPHHENEIAQSRCHTGDNPANYWLHNGMVTVENRKMSKSLGNFITAQELATQFHPEIIRLHLLKTHYRKILKFNRAALAETAENLDRMYNTLVRFDKSPSLLRETHPSPEPGEENDAFVVAMCDDFNTPSAFASLSGLSRQLNGLDKNDRGVNDLLMRYIRYGRLFGIFNTLPNRWFGVPRVNTRNKTETLSEEKILAFVQERNTARNDKNWKRADEIRHFLKNNGITIEDTGEKTLWHYD